MSTGLPEPPSPACSGRAAAWLETPRAAQQPQQVTATVSVDELRALLREDVREVVRAELQASRASRGRSGPSCSSQQLGWASPDKRGVTPAAAPGSGDGPGGSPNGADRQRGAETSSHRYVTGDEGEATMLPSELEQQYALLEEAPRASSRQMGGQWRYVFQVLEKFWSLEEPPRQGALANCIASNGFHMFFNAVVACNVGFMIYAANQDIQNIGKESNAEAFQWSVDTCFQLLFTIELVCKLTVHRCFFFWNSDAPWNWLDFILVAQGLQLLLMQISDPDAGDGRSDGSMRMLRILKVTKILRLMRAFKFFTELHLIFSAIIGSMIQLFWSIVVFAMLFLIVSVYLTSTVAIYLKNVGSTEGKEEQTVLLYFGSVATSARTLFMTVFQGASWSDYYFALVPMAGACHYVYLFLVAFLQLALLNIVTGIFVERALKISQPDIHEQAEERFMEERKYANELRLMFGPADISGDGYADKELLETMVRDDPDGRIVHYLRFLNIDPLWSKHNLSRIFDRVADQNDDGVSITALVERIMAMRGSARSTEIFDLRQMLRHVQSLQEQMMSKINSMGCEGD